MTQTTHPPLPQGEGEGSARGSSEHTIHPKEQRRENRRIERLWRRGKIPFAAFDWWLRTMSGV